jgi:hypothetical protein
MNRVLALFYFYVAMCWHEWEQFLAMVIKAAINQADYARIPHVKGLKGERRCCRGFVPRGRSRYRAVLNNKVFLPGQSVCKGPLLSARPICTVGTW